MNNACMNKLSDDDNNYDNKIFSTNFLSIHLQNLLHFEDQFMSIVSKNPSQSCQLLSFCLLLPSHYSTHTPIP